MRGTLPIVRAFLTQRKCDAGANRRLLLRRPRRGRREPREPGSGQTKVAAATRYSRATRRTAGALSGVEVRAGGDVLPFRDLFRARVCDIAIKGQSVGAQEQESRGLV